MLRDRRARREEIARIAEHRALAHAINRSHIRIELTLDGTIIAANANALHILGCSATELIGRHHRTLVDPAEAGGPAEAQFEALLRHGKPLTGEFKRITNDGRAIWLQAAYEPILDATGAPLTVVLLAFDVTAQKQATALFEGEIAAIGRSTGVIHFSLDGTIVDANENFLAAVGYERSDVRGRHHRMFVEPAFAASPAYRDFWDRLGQGTFVAGEFKRVAKDGRTVWLKASYNPIFDSGGQPVRIVMFATDVTKARNTAAQFRGEVEAIRRSQAVIHFALDGSILWANEAFLRSVGYASAEIVGRHHRIFVDDAYARSREYADLWTQLRAGKPQAGQFKRFTKDGRTLWLNATYTPILDNDGRPFMIVKFATDVTALVDRKTDQSRLVESTFDTIIASVENASAQSQAAADASQLTASTVKAVAASAARLDASIGEIARSVTQCRTSVVELLQKRAAADASTQRLCSRVESMNTIVSSISKIAEQIDLLSLNASIEAARAAGAGRGFAVVANEIKSLAHQAGGASDTIRTEIRDVQTASADVAGALVAIAQALQTVVGAVDTTATAVDEQSAVTRNISSNMANASQSVSSINLNLSDIRRLVAGADVAAREGKTKLNDAIVDDSGQPARPNAFNLM